MHRFRTGASSCLVLFLCISAAAAAQAPVADAPGSPAHSPLRLMPEQADLLIQVPQPRRLVETLLTLDTLKQVRQLAPVRELYDSTNVRRFLQLVAYFEKELGMPWPQLLDRLAGRGAVLGVQFGPDPAPALLILEGEDEKLTQQFYQLGMSVLEQELARQENKNKPVKGVYRHVPTVQIGKEFHAAVAGNVLFLSNNEKALHAGLDRFCDGGKKSMADVPGIADAAKLLPRNPLASLWLKMEKIQQSPGAKAAYKAPPRDDPALTALFGHYLNLLGRAPFVSAAFYEAPEGLALTIRTPAGREGMEGDRLLHVPPAGAPGSRPLLEPKNVLYSESGYFDLANVWNERKVLFNDKQVKGLEKAETQARPFLAGAKLSKLLTQAGPYYRFVAVHPAKMGYKTKPKIVIPSFALVWELREPEAFGKSMETILRGAAFLGGGQFNLKSVEEKYHDCKLVGYRFPEDQPLKGDVNDLRFNFTPCFTRVGNQFVISSTLELGRELIDLLQKEDKSDKRGDASSARLRIYGAGAAAYLQTIEDLLITQTTLDQALTPGEARQQVKAFLEVVRGMGALSLEPRFHDRTFEYNIRFQAKKESAGK